MEWEIKDPGEKVARTRWGRKGRSQTALCLSSGSAIYKLCNLELLRPLISLKGFKGDWLILG